MCGLLFVSPRSPSSVFRFVRFASTSAPPRGVAHAVSQKTKIFDIFPSHRAIATRHPPRTRAIDARISPNGDTARAPPSFASRATPRVKITRRRGRITIARPSHRASVRPDPAPRRASARAPARRNIFRARASRSRALASLAHLLCVVQTTRRKVARGVSTSREYSRSSRARGRRTSPRRSREIANRHGEVRRRRSAIDRSRSRDVGGAIGGNREKTCNKHCGIAAGVGP